jgi:transcriptional regulator with XRE-family HTH domain
VKAAPLVQDFEDQRWRLLGARLQELRRARGLSLKQVGEEVGLSASFLSMVERGRTDLSLARFSRLAEIYRVQPSELMLELSSDYDPPEIKRPSAYRRIERGAGVDYRVLQDENPQLVRVVLEPGSRFKDLRAHRGEDLWIVVRGRARLHYGNGSWDIDAGQTARFSATIPHGISNPFDAATELVALCSTPYW